MNSEVRTDYLRATPSSFLSLAMTELSTRNPASAGFEYRTTFATIPEDFPNRPRITADLARISPKPPRGEAWKLVSSCAVSTREGPLIFYYWERPLTPEAQEQRQGTISRGATLS